MRPAKPADPAAITAWSTPTAGVTPELVRLSIGLEDVEDIIWDLDQALQAAMGA